MITMKYYMPTTGQFGKVKIFQKHTLSKTKSRAYKNSNRPITSKEIESIIKEIPNEDNPTTIRLLWKILPNISKRVGTNSSQTLPQN